MSRIDPPTPDDCGVTVTITAMVVARMRVWSTRSTFCLARMTFCHGDGGCQNLIRAQRGGGASMFLPI